MNAITERLALTPLPEQTTPAKRRLPTACRAAALLLTACIVFGQSIGRPKFEVAAVKPTFENNRDFAGMRPLPGGRLHAGNVPVRMLIARAYRLQDFQIVGGPDWLRHDGFDIEAKGDPNAEMMLMLQSLLEDRFHLKYHRDMRELPVYALSVARGGPKLPAPKAGGCVRTDGSTPPSEPGRAALPRCGSMNVLTAAAGMTARGGDLPMAELIRSLSFLLGRPVLDRTGVTTRFDVHLDFAVDDTLAGLSSAWGSVQGHAETMASASAPANPAAAPGILTALPEQLGLRLDSAKGPVEVMVIDSVEKPHAN